ncbi:hypothetical protein [Fictibacillus phosphorivorans]|uniref:hypothetical protein n=1 Tax=Fictibacillus phosphorivorans TaxID=1221500 RepID=UPI001293E4A0|nr:hypothetical protein [Fictibacillus phosphorivorans]
MPKYPFWDWDLMGLNTRLGVMASFLYRLNESLADAKFPFWMVLSSGLGLGIW